MKTRFFLTITLISIVALQAQQNPGIAAFFKQKTDSLNATIKNGKNDTNKVNSLNLLSAYSTEKFDRRFEYLDEAIALSEKLNYNKGKCASFYYKGHIYTEMGIYPKAIECLLRSMKLCEELKNQNERSAKILLAIGEVYVKQNNYQKALDYYLQALKEIDVAPRTNVILAVLSHISVAYEHLGNQTKAAQYEKRSKTTFDSILQKMGGKHKKLRAVFGSEGEALIPADDLVKSLNEIKKTNNKQVITQTLLQIGKKYFKENNYEKSIQYLNECMVAAKDANLNDLRKQAYENLVFSYEAINDLKNALVYHKLYAALKDTLLNHENNKQIAQMNAMYAGEKKDNEIKRQKIIIYAASAGLFLLLTLALVILRSLRINKKKNIIIRQQKENVEKQKDLIEEHQKEIIDSIRYARRIQTALLPTEKYITKKLRSLNE